MIFLLSYLVKLSPVSITFLQHLCTASLKHLNMFISYISIFFVSKITYCKKCLQTKYLLYYNYFCLLHTFLDV